MEDGGDGWMYFTGILLVSKGLSMFKQDGGFWPLKSGRITDDTRGLMNPVMTGIKTYHSCA